MTEEVQYRLKLATGYLAEAAQDFDLGRWRSCVDNSQLATENAAKAVLATAGPVGRTHAPGSLLRQLAAGSTAPESRPALEDLASLAERLGAAVHVATDYGDEGGWRTPWELFGREDAEDALSVARQAVELATSLLGSE